VTTSHAYDANLHKQQFKTTANKNNNNNNKHQKQTQNNKNTTNDNNNNKSNNSRHSYKGGLATSANLSLCRLMVVATG